MFEEKQKKLGNKLKEIIKTNMEKDNKRKIESLVVFVVILVITVVLINVIWNGDKNIEKEKLNEGKILAQTKAEQNNDEMKSISLEEKIENILQNIEGVGKAKVLLTYSESSQTIAMYNEDKSQSDTEEMDNGGGNRKITQSSNKREVIYQEIGGEKIPVTQSIVEPKIEGAIVTASGAGNSVVKNNIVQAIEAATGLATHKIQVFEMASN